MNLDWKVLFHCMLGFVLVCNYYSTYVLLESRSVVDTGHVQCHGIGRLPKFWRLDVRQDKIFRTAE